jgi:spermidine/putrescine transport system ATP-binding protein
MDRSTGAPAVELLGVTKRFGAFIAVDNVSLRIEQGEFFSLLGPSGCGKTTTLRMVAGFAYPDEGDVMIAGRIVNDVPAFRRDTNLVFQQLALFPHLDVFDNIAFGLVVKKRGARTEVNERVRKALDLVELGGFETRRIKQLSGGQQQRVAIARALINEPSVLLLDEPLGALDLKLRLQMQLELKAIQHRVGITFVYVTHDQGEALTMSDRIAVMNKGRIEQIAASEEIYSRPATRFVAGFIGDTNLLDGTVVSGGDGVVVVDVGGLLVRVAGPPQAVGSAVSISLRPEQIRLGPITCEGAPENSFDARVTKAIFIGSMLRYEITLSTGLKLMAQVTNDAGRLWRQDELVPVWWTGASGVLLEPKS